MTDVFDDMIRRSIPEHDEMRVVVASLAATFAQEGTVVLDLGCSRGEALATVRDQVRARRPELRSVLYRGAEVSEPMLAAARERFAGEEDVAVEAVDLRHAFPAVSVPASVILSVLTLQFVPVNYRLRIIERCFRHLVDGGVLILVEKVLGASSVLDDAEVALYHDLKRRHGYSEEEVVRKAASLEGVLVPLTAAWNQELLRGAGFSAVDCIWAWLNFRAWIAVK